MEILQVALSHPPRAVASPSSDAVSGLSRALRALGHETTVVVPFHKDFVNAGLPVAKRLSPLALESGAPVDVLETQLPSGLHLVLLDVPGAAECAPPADEAGNASLLTESRAQALGRFAGAVAAYVSELVNTGRAPDVLHAHDAEAGLCLLALDRAAISGCPPTVLSVHDAQAAGRAELALAEVLGIPPALRTAHSFAMGEYLCLLKGLLGLAGAVVVPSQAYARSLCTPERYGALSRAFAAEPPLGIFDGIDVAVFNPATDSSLTARFDAADPSPKGVCKAGLQKGLELHVGAEHPLVLAEPSDSGELSTLLSALPALMRQDIQLALLLPEPPSDELAALLLPFAGQARALTRAHLPTERRKFLAGSDFYLSVKRSDPAGIALRQAMRYGAIPVALEVDSVSDHVIDCDAQLISGTGILVEAPTQRGVASGVGRAVAAFRATRFDELRKRVMRQDASWDRSSRQLLQLYGKLRAQHV